VSRGFSDRLTSYAHNVSGLVDVERCSFYNSVDTDWFVPNWSTFRHIEQAPALQVEPMLLLSTSIPSLHQLPVMVYLRGNQWVTLFWERGG